MRKEKNFLIEVQVDDPRLRESTENYEENVSALVFQELGWVEDSGIFARNVKELTLEGKQVYRLCGEDVISVLQDMGLKEIIEDEERLRDMIEYVANKLIIPWDEYIEATIKARLEFFKGM